MSQHTLLDLSRWQWALTAVFHITFPAVTVGTSIFLIISYWMYMRTDDEVWLRTFRLWRRIFGIAFAIGVVSGIVLTFEFGLNWGIFAHDVGPIVGVMILMEVLTAFFLEAGFLGLLVYGDGRISKRMMMFSTCMVSLGTVLSTTWILVANSWMQTPAGFSRTADGQFQPSNWLKVIFNPSFPIRFVHMLIGAVIAALFLIAGVSAWYLLKRRHLGVARRGLSVGLGVLAILVPLQMFVGDHTIDYVLQYKPAEAVAMEANWKPNTGYNLLVIPRQNGPSNIWQVSIPWFGSALSKDFSGHTAIPPASIVPNNRRPSILTTFYGFRVMWFGSLLMLAVVMAGVILRLRGRLFSTRWFQRVLLVTLPLGFFAVWGGWILAETGRQPWTVYGYLQTAASVSNLKTAQVLVSLIGFIAVYMLLLGVFARYVIRVVRQGPEAPTVGEPGARKAPTLGPPPEMVSAN